MSTPDLDLKDIGSDGLVTIVGQRGSGVSTIALHIWKASGIKRALVYDPVAENALSIFHELLNPIYIHHEIDEKFLERVMHHQSKTKEPLCWMIDNASLSRGPAKDKLCQAIATAKQLGVLIVYCSQYILDVPISIRKATDWWIVQPKSSQPGLIWSRLEIDPPTQPISNGAFVVIRKEPSTNHCRTYQHTPTPLPLISSYEFMHPDAIKAALDAFDGRKFLNHVLNSRLPPQLVTASNPASDPAHDDVAQKPPSTDAPSSDGAAAAASDHAPADAAQKAPSTDAPPSDGAAAAVGIPESFRVLMNAAFVK